MSLDIDLFVEVNTGGENLKKIYLFSVNITHNLNGMAKEAGFYQHLWRPEEIGARKAGDIIGAMETGLALMIADPERFKQFDASNGWGTYDDLLRVVSEYLDACKEHPEALIRVSR